MGVVGTIVTGGEELEHRLKALPDRLGRRYSKKALEAGGRPIVADYKANVPVRFGFLRRAIGTVYRAYDKSYVLVIGARKDVAGAIASGKARFSHSIGGEKMAVPALYAHLVEGGTRPHSLGAVSTLERRSTRMDPATGKRKSVVLGPGRQYGIMHPGARPKPALEPAVEAHRQEVPELVAGVLREGLADAASG